MDLLPPVELMHTLPGVFHYYFCDGHELRRPIHADWSPEITGLAATFRFIPVGASRLVILSRPGSRYLQAPLATLCIIQQLPSGCNCFDWFLCYFQVEKMLIFRAIAGILRQSTPGVVCIPVFRARPAAGAPYFPKHARKRVHLFSQNTPGFVFTVSA